MDNKWRRFAPVGLVIALLAALASVGLFIVFREMNVYLQVSLSLIIFGLALFVIFDPKRTRELLTGRQARYGSNVLVLSLAFFGILAVINYIVFKNPQRWDLTEDKGRTLLPETIDALKNLPQPVKAVAFYLKSDAGSQQAQVSAEKLLEDYKYYSNGKFDFEVIDPNENPVAAKAANVRIGSGGTIIIQMGDRQERPAFATEEELTGALVRLINQEDVTVYFLQGHDEYSLTGTEGRSYSDAKQVLERKGYTLKELSLLSEKTIPADAKVIVVAGPLKPLTEDEVVLLDGYLKNGGSMVALMEPEVFTNYGDADDPLAKSLAENWGIHLTEDVVIDGTTWQGLGPYTTVGFRYADHPITEEVQGLQTAYITARSIQATEAISDVISTGLIFTHPQQSWAETDMEGIKNEAVPEANPDEDMIGNIPLAVASENSATGARIVVLGDPDFAGNGNFDFLGNGDLFVNSLDWASEQEDVINITPRTPTQRFMLPPTQVRLGLIILVSCFIIPGTFLAIGIVVAVQRRRKG